jgi:hypothetical protein
MNGLMLDPPAVLAFPLTGMRLIEASAGTGKTYTIANLYLRHVVEGCEVAEVLVVTFTVAATDELRGRIRARLFEALALSTIRHGRPFPHWAHRPAGAGSRGQAVSASGFRCAPWTRPPSTPSTASASAC